jgi:hypothetical protein
MDSITFEEGGPAAIIGKPFDREQQVLVLFRFVSDPILSDLSRSAHPLGIRSSPRRIGLPFYLPAWFARTHPHQAPLRTIRLSHCPSLVAWLGVCR